MNLVRKWLFRLLMLAIGLLALLAGSYNSTPVALNFLGYESFELPVSGWMIVAFVVGVLFGIGLNVWTNTRLRLNAHKAGREVKSAYRELDQVKQESLVEG